MHLFRLFCIVATILLPISCILFHYSLFQPQPRDSVLTIYPFCCLLSLNYSGMCLASDAQFSDFLDGMGPAQFVGRQTLAMTSMGDVEIGLMERNGGLEVEVVQARRLTIKPGSKGPPGKSTMLA
ncbi:hypothetical protein AMECASPLE_037756 [Ameca splendens]|uniref:Uncharacterized protein n=1 Tax=Ameca splendens TaxID=208324 RepID=A0ABV0Y8N7_9TELE